MKIPFWMVRSSGFHDQVWQGRRPQTLIDPVNPVNPVPQDAAQMGLWVSLKMGILEPTGWGLWITLGYQMISNDDSSTRLNFKGLFEEMISGWLHT